MYKAQLIKEYVSFFSGKTDKSNLIPDNASWYMAIHFESLMKASYKIVKRLFCLNYILQKYHRSVSNVAMVCVAAVALGSSTYAWFVSNNQVTADADKIVVLKDATVFESGSPVELTRKGGIYADMVKKQHQAAGWKL